MALPEEDRGPAWLRDWRDIKVDIREMAEFAAALRAEVQLNYVPHLSTLYDDMAAALPPPAAEFTELVSLLKTQQAAQQTTSDLVHFYATATGGFATAAETISRRYGQADAFSAARVTVVEAALHRSGVTSLAAATGEES